MNELESMWKEAVKAYFKALFRLWPGGIEEKHFARTPTGYILFARISDLEKRAKG
jgi:hypothetical protein